MILSFAYSTPTTAYAPFEPPIEVSAAISPVEALIREYSGLYEVSYNKMYYTLKCESGFKPNAVGDGGHSFGVAQIHLPSHPTVSREQALDPDFPLRWTAQQFAKGNAKMWTCYRLLFL